jgi:hypothetical protein
MNLFFSVIIVFISTNSFAAQLTDLKISSNWKVKFNPNEWSYVYLKPLRAVSPNIFEHRKEKFNVILQKETHFDGTGDYQKLLENKCSIANESYSKSSQGFAEVVKINKKNVCYIEFKNAKGETTRQFVYPELSASKNYELYSYGWNSKNIKSKAIVINFLKGFL